LSKLLNNSRVMITNVDKCDPMCVHQSHPFMYLLSSTELNAFQNIGEEIFEKNSTISQEFVRSYYKEESALHSLYLHLKDFFSLNPKKSFFLKLSSISPKDSFSIYHGIESNSEEDDFEIIKRDISFLKVGNPIYSSSEKAASSCIQILCHSNRIYLDILFEQSKKPLHVLLLDWKETNLKAETRCLIANFCLVAITQYFVDFTDCYDNLGEIETIYNNIILFVKEQIKHLPSSNVSLDLDITKEGINLIEYNGLLESDKCLFEKNEIDDLIEKSSEDSFMAPFRFVQNGIKKQIH